MPTNFIEKGGGENPFLIWQYGKECPKITTIWKVGYICFLFGTAWFSLEPYYPHTFMSISTVGTSTTI